MKWDRKFTYYFFLGSCELLNEVSWWICINEDSYTFLLKINLNV